RFGPDLARCGEPGSHNKASNRILDAPVPAAIRFFRRSGQPGGKPGGLIARSEATMSLLTVPIGKNAPREVHAIIEIPKGSSNKYEFDLSLDTFVLDRVLFSPLYYPFDYGFIAGTLSGD